MALEKGVIRGADDDRNAGGGPIQTQQIEDGPAQRRPLEVDIQNHQIGPLLPDAVIGQPPLSQGASLVACIAQERHQQRAYPRIILNNQNGCGHGDDALPS